MKVIRNIFSRLHDYVLWLLASVIFWAWIFTIITDTRPQYKVTLFIDTYDAKTTELAMRLEETMPDGLKMVKVRLFSYALFTSDEINRADLFVVRESEAEQYLSAFAPLDELTLPEGEYTYYHSEDGTAYGLCIHDAAQSVASDYLLYEVEGAPQEPYYLFFGNQSLHLGQEESRDDAAMQIAAEFLALK